MRMLRTVLAVAAVVLVSQRLVSGEDAKGLQEMIDAAPAGGVVVVPKGVWTEPVRVPKPLTLRGEDRDGSVLEVVSDEPAVRLAHDKGEATLEKLTIRWKRATSDRPSGPLAAVVSKDGGLRMRDVRVVASDNYARCPSAFTAVGFGETTIEGCEFDGYEFTIQFADGAKGTIKDCVVTNPGHCGITAGPESTVNVAGTIVTGSRYHGLRCTGGELNVENCLVVANKNRGIYLGNRSARGTVRENVIQGNGTGISAFAESEVKVHNNFIGGSDFAGVDMRDGCRLDVERNLLANNSRGIVLFKEAGRNRNSIGENASVGNKTETEGFEQQPKMRKVEGEVAEGEFAMEGAKGFGLSDPERIKPLWKRWTSLREGASAKEAAGG